MHLCACGNRNRDQSRGHLLQMRSPLILDTSLLQIAIAVYIVAIGLHEIHVRDLLGRIVENRFQRIAMSMSEGRLH